MAKELKLVSRHLEERDLALAQEASRFLEATGNGTLNSNECGTNIGFKET